MARAVTKPKTSLFTVVISFAVAVFIIGVGVVVVLASTNSAAADAVNQPANMASGAVAITEGGIVTSPAQDDVEAIEPLAETDDVIDVRIYLDYLCPFCQQFELQYGAEIETLAANGEARVAYFPVAILDPASAGTRYSTRAVNAASCVVENDPDRFSPFHMAMFVNQPGEGVAGLSDDQIFDIYASVGGTSEDVRQCIADEPFRGWAKLLTDSALESISPLNVPLQGVPAVIVDGELYDGEEDFRVFIERKMVERAAS